MKKILSILFASVFLFTSVGMTFSVHYCMGKVEKIAMVLGDRETTCRMEEEPNACKDANQLTTSCCNNKQLQIQVKDNYLKPQITTFDFNKVIVAVVHFISDTFNISTSDIFTFNHSPPLLFQQSLSILFQVFRL